MTSIQFSKTNFPLGMTKDAVRYVRATGIASLPKS